MGAVGCTCCSPPRLLCGGLSTCSTRLLCGGLCGQRAGITGGPFTPRSLTAIRSPASPRRGSLCPVTPAPLPLCIPPPLSATLRPQHPHNLPVCVPACLSHPHLLLPSSPPESPPISICLFNSHKRKHKHKQQQLGAVIVLLWKLDGF